MRLERARGPPQIKALTAGGHGSREERTKSMTERQAKEGRGPEGVGPRICSFGSSTDAPCRRPATVVPDGEDEPRLCYPHAHAAYLGDVIYELGSVQTQLEERMREIARWAMEHPDE